MPGGVKGIKAEGVGGSTNNALERGKGVKEEEQRKMKILKIYEKTS